MVAVVLDADCMARGELAERQSQISDRSRRHTGPLEVVELRKCVYRTRSDRFKPYRYAYKYALADRGKHIVAGFKRRYFFIRDREIQISRQRRDLLDIHSENDDSGSRQSRRDL